MNHHHQTRVRQVFGREEARLFRKTELLRRRHPEPSDRVRMSPWTLATVCLLGLLFAWIAGCSDRPSADATVPARRPCRLRRPTRPCRIPATRPRLTPPCRPRSPTAAGPSAVAGGQARAAPAADQPPSASAEPAKAPRREPLFAGWPKPHLALFITGQQHGYIEPCGCTGLTNQKGGLVRRFACKKQLEQQAGRWSRWTPAIRCAVSAGSRRSSSR